MCDHLRCLRDLVCVERHPDHVQHTLFSRHKLLTPIDVFRDSGGTLWVVDRDGRALDITLGGNSTPDPGFASSATASEWPDVRKHLETRLLRHGTARP